MQINLRCCWRTNRKMTSTWIFSKHFQFASSEDFLMMNLILHPQFSIILSLEFSPFYDFNLSNVNEAAKAASLENR